MPPLPGRLLPEGGGGGCGSNKCRLCGGKDYPLTRLRKRLEKRRWQRLVRTGKADEA